MKKFLKLAIKSFFAIIVFMFLYYFVLNYISQPYFTREAEKRLNQDMEEIREKYGTSVYGCFDLKVISKPDAWRTFKILSYEEVDNSEKLKITYQPLFFFNLPIFGTHEVECRTR